MSDHPEEPSVPPGKGEPDPLAKALGWKGARLEKHKPPLPPKAKEPAPPPEVPLLPLAKEIPGMPMPEGLPAEKETKDPQRRSRFGLGPVVEGPLPGEPKVTPTTLERLRPPEPELEPEPLPPFPASPGVPMMPLAPEPPRTIPMAPVDLEPVETRSPFDLAPAAPGSLPGEPEPPPKGFAAKPVPTPAGLMPLAAAMEEAIPLPGAIPLADEVPVQRELAVKAAEESPPVGAAPRSRPKPRPKLQVDRPLWEPPEEVEGTRAGLAVALMLIVIGLYAWMLSFYYAGAHGGVDQAGYLMTARLMAGDRNVDNPDAPAHPTPAESGNVEPAGGTMHAWQGAAEGYLPGIHDQPSGIQTSAIWDALRNRLSFVPESPFQFVSHMCIMTEPFGPASPDLPKSPGKPAEYRVFAKYPAGYPLLAAIGRTVGGWFDHAQVMTLEKTGKHTQVVKAEAVGRGLDGMYVVNPLCTVLACVFAYFLFRQVVSPFVSLIGVLWLATNPLVLIFANDANSHASTLMCVCLGFWALLSFLRTRQTWRAWIAGLALGYACTIRYSEFLLVLPVLVAAAMSVRRTWKGSKGAVALLAGWAIPVVLLGIVCWVSFGSPFKNGYSYDHEDTGFGWRYLVGNTPEGPAQGNWNLLLGELNQTGLYVLWALAVAGLFGMIGASWRLGALLASWILPTCLLYLLYYWSGNAQNAVGYLRFFMSIVPGLILCGLWLIERALVRLIEQPSRDRQGATQRRAEDEMPWASLLIATALGLFLLLIVAFYGDGGPGAEASDGGAGHTIWALIKQAPLAVMHLFTHSWLGLFWGLGILAAVVGMWLYDAPYISRRLGVALGAGAITAIGCAVNVANTAPLLERQHAHWTAFRVTVDNLRETLPRGTAIFCDDGMLQQLDCVGGWKLYDLPYFSSAAYARASEFLQNHTAVQRADDPDPVQTERARFIVELLANDTGGAPARQHIVEMLQAVVDKNIAQGHRVVFLVLDSPGDAGSAGEIPPGPDRDAQIRAATGITPRLFVPQLPGYKSKLLRKWTVSPDPTDAPPAGQSLTLQLPEATTDKPATSTPAATTAPAGRAVRAGGAASAPARGNPVPAGPAGMPIIDRLTPAPASQQGATYALYEIEKSE